MNIDEQKRIWGDLNNWVTEGQEWSSYFGSSDNLWSTLYPKIESYLKGDILEIAPGYGRITKYLLDNSNNFNSLSIIDLNEICIKSCIDKFGSKIRNYIVNDGKSLNFNDQTFDFILSFDSFVHITSDVIEYYIKEMNRTLKKDGYGFIHHSFFFGNDNPSENIAGRSNMTPDLFRKLVEKYNMRIILQEDFKVSKEVNDTISIFQK